MSGDLPWHGYTHPDAVRDLVARIVCAHTDRLEVFTKSLISYDLIPPSSWRSAITDATARFPKIIQGGMGISISTWRLARAVALCGQLGVVSGTGLNLVFALRLQEGDPDGDLRRAIATFPVPEIAQKVLRDHYRDPAEGQAKKSKTVPMFTYRPSRDLLNLTVLANYCEVWLAKEGHDGAIGINLLEKVQLPNLASLYGAMLAGVDVVLMGAGIPREIPMVLDRFAKQQSAKIRLAVEGATATDDYYAEFDPATVIGTTLPVMKRPKFFAIVSSEVLAKALLARTTGAIDGFVVEGHIAGGHNAPPRGGVKLDETGQPIYGPRDTANLSAFAELGVPFWIAGGQATPEKLGQALAIGAEGVQVGTDFAFCEESGFAPSIRKQVLQQVYQGSAIVHTDPLASPTGFPFKVVQLEGTMSDPLDYAERPRLCQLGFLRRLYKRDDGSVGYRCPGEPEEDFLRKGGKAEEMEGKKCLCNALIANIGLPQTHKDGYLEKPLVTAGDNLGELRHYLSPDKMHYTAKDVIEYLLGDIALDQHTTSDACLTDC